MSNGPKGKHEVGTTRFITLDADEFNKVCQRLHKMLSSRVDKAWKKHAKHPTDKSSDNHVEASKDAFAFIHLMEMVESMTAQIAEMQMELEMMSGGDDGEYVSPVGPPRQKTYLN